MWILALPPRLAGPWLDRDGQGLKSFYELDYLQAGVRSRPLSLAWTGGGAWLGAVALLLITRLAFLWRRRGHYAAARRASCAASADFSRFHQKSMSLLTP
jgi:hypothetical protein